MDDTQTFSHGDFSPGFSQFKGDRSISPESSCVSMKSDWSMDNPITFKGKHTSTDLSQFKGDRSISPESSYVSMKSDRSMDNPITFKGKHTSTDLRPPELELKNTKGLPYDKIEKLHTGLNKLIKAGCGEESESAVSVQPTLERQTSPSSESKAKKVFTNRFRTTSSSRHRRDTYNEDNPRNSEVLHFSNRFLGHTVVHRGKCIGESERLGRSVYYALNSTSGEFVVYEWILCWNKTNGKFFTGQEKEKIEKCKKQIDGAKIELNSLLKLKHPNLVHYRALSCRKRKDCLVVNLLAEHVPGSSLAQSLSSSTPVPVDRLRNHAVQLVAALDYLHSNSVVHKQLSLSCVLLDAQGNVRLADYSLAKRLADVCIKNISEQGHVRFSKDSLPTRTGKKGDVWSLGLLLLALAQGQAVKEYPVTVPSTLPADLHDFLNRCVCLNDADRWHTHQLLDHPFLRPPLPKNVVACQEFSSEDKGVDFASTDIPRSHHLSAPFSAEVQKQFSHYYNEFSELHLLGKGAFGAVIKVQNKLDGCNYAVKQIQVNPASKQFRRIKGEVTLLSRLNHGNIVRYYNAWIERHESPSTGALNSDSSEAFSTPEQSLRPAAPSRRHELGLIDNVEDYTLPPALASSVEWSTLLERSSSTKCSAADSTYAEEDDDEEADVFCPSFL